MRKTLQRISCFIVPVLAMLCVMLPVSAYESVFSFGTDDAEDFTRVEGTLLYVDEDVSEETIYLASQYFSMLPDELIYMFTENDVRFYISSDIDDKTSAAVSYSAGIHYYLNTGEIFEVTSAPYAVFDADAVAVYPGVILHEAAHLMEYTAVIESGIYAGNNTYSLGNEWESIYYSSLSDLLSVDDFSLANAAKGPIEGFAEAFRETYDIGIDMSEISEEAMNYVFEVVADCTES